ncbi:MAG: hypothetical protein KJP08_08075 [Gammaproteobacteria bacterium]|nr:hypothetical protein [Gammaproteobacteria bacterium]MBT8094752.1 hypothetical protein [Gammaproteobacteria bacterium]NNL63166.1 hypothetical protein [Woeseiaceae bacterium]
MTEGEKRSLLLVHGRDFKPAAEVYLDIAVEAIRAGLERDYPDCVACFDNMAKELAWYGDLNAAVLEKAGGSYDEPLDVGDRRNAMQALKELTPRKKFGVRLYDRLPGKSALPEFFMDIGAPVLGAVGFRMPVLGKIAKDFAAYLDEPGFAVDARARLRDRLCAMLDRGDRVMLISHGTGSVIAYDVLWELSNDTDTYPEYGNSKIDHWLTLGSPLGDRAVQKRLLGARERGDSRFPCNVISWHNLAAEDDYACHDTTLADDFRQMLVQKQVSAVQDYKIFNLAVRYGKSNPHSSVGYYIHPRLSKIFADWIN